MANYGPYYGSFGGYYSNVYSQLKIENWTVASDRVTFTAYGGYWADYNWNINYIACELWWGENGNWHSMKYADGFSISTGSGGGNDWWISQSDYFSRQSYDRYITLTNDLTFSGNKATAFSDSLTIPHLAAAPSNLTATRNSDTSITLNWTNPSTSYDSMKIEASRNGGSYSQIASVSTSTSYTWTGAVADSVYDIRLRSYYQNSYSSYTASIKAYTTPTAPSGLSYSRASDTKVNLSWANNSSSYTQVRVERSTDGGAWSQIASLSKGTTSYSDTTTSADHSYKYRIRAYNGGLYSSYNTGSSTVVMTPAAPTKITTAAAGGTNVTVTLTNPSNVATKVQYQVSTGGGASWGTTQESANLTSFSVSIVGTEKVRARNYNSTGTSAWITSDFITTICPPNPPTLTAPSSNILNIADGSITFSWLHNSLDGSTQQNAELDYSTDGGSTWTQVQNIGTAQSYTMAIPWNPGDTVTWRVKTKGADASFSDWSATKTFNVYEAPSVNITAPSGLSPITSMPVSISADYTDMVGFTCEQASYTLRSNGAPLFSEPMSITATANGTTLTASLDVNEFLPENGGTYEIVVNARSSSSLEYETNVTFGINFAEPVEGGIEITDDPDTGYAYIMASFDNTGAPEPAVNISVSRINPDGSMTPLLENADNNSGVTDKFAPLNTPYQYAVTTHASSQAVKTVYFDNIIESNRWFAYWGDNLAWAAWNPDGNYTLTRPEKIRVRYAGRKWPVSYDSKAIEQRHSMTWTVLDMDDWSNGFVQLMEDGGRGVYKSCDGAVFHADFEYSATPEYTSATRIGSITLTIVRIDGDKL